MTLLLLGLVIFLGVHSVRVFADDWRSRTLARVGPGAWKGGYTVVSLVGLALLVWGYGVARATPLVLWTPPTAMRHVAALLMLMAFVLLAAAYVPRNPIKARLHHPMLLATKVWAFAHLLANGTLADLVLFGSFLVWAVVLFAASRRRDRAAGTVYAASAGAAPLLATLAAGAVGFALFAFALHGPLFGVRPFGG